jgi:hypothetical protein
VSDELEPAVTELSVELAAGTNVEATVTLSANGAPMGRGRIERPARDRLAYAGLDIGRDRGPGVGRYLAPFAFTGSIRRVVVTTGPDTDLDRAGALAVELASG